MKSLRFTPKASRLIATAIACLAMVGAANAQVQTERNTFHGTAARTVKIDRGEVLYVSGNDLVIKKDDGTIEHYANVPDTATVDGKQVKISDLEPGMKLERTMTTTTTPRTVKTVETVTGTVWRVHPPLFVILTLQDGTVHKFDLPADHKVLVEGRTVDAWSLKKGMKISATRVTEAAETVVERQTHITGTGLPPEVFPSNEPVFFTMLTPPAPAFADAPPAELPETGSMLPLVGLLGVLALGASMRLRAIRVTA